MNLIRNILAVIGLAAILVLAVAFPKVNSVVSRFSEFDEKALDAYKELAEKIIETGNAAEATVWKVKVQDDIAVEDVEQSMRLVANEHNIKNVGELPLSKQVASMKGNDYRFVKIFMFCNALTAAKMLDYNDAYSAYLPCRVSLIEDKNKQLWLYSLNMDLMIHGGTPLPPELKEEALKVKMIIQDIMKRGAAGDF